MKKITIYVEGNVGAGKSTLLDFIQKHVDVQVALEPLALWQNVSGHDLLEQFFKNQSRWAFTLQTYVTLTRVDQLNELAQQKQKKILLIERSVYSARYCFARNAFDMHLFTDLEWELYKLFWNRFVQEITAQPDGFIYLRIPAALCYQRIIKRNRFEEKPILLEYLVNLEKKHDDWLLYNKENNHLKNVPVLVLNTIEDLRKDHVMQQEYIRKIQEFIHTVQKI